MLIVMAMTIMVDMKMVIMGALILAMMVMFMAIHIKYDGGHGDDDVGYYDIKYIDHAIK